MTLFDRRSALGLGAAALATLRPLPVWAQSRNFQWGSSSLGSTGYVIMEGLANTVNRHTDMRHASMATSGGTENMQLFHEGVIQFGQTTSTDWLPARDGMEPYPEPITVHQMFAYTLFNCTPMVRADSDIQTLEDLRGRRLMPSPAGSSTATMWEVLFTAAGLQDDLRYTYGSWRETYDALRGGAVDCIPSLLTNGRPSPIMEEIGATVPLRILPVSEELILAAQELNPGISLGLVPGGVVPGIDEDVMAASFSGVLGVSPDVSEDDAYAVMVAIFDHLDDVHALGVQFLDIEPQFGADFLVAGFPIHKGAARFYKERGLWRDDMVEAA